MHAFPAIDHRLLREQVHSYLVDAIAHGDVATGSFLDQTRLCAELGVSRAPLRDALIQLEAEGVVSIVPRRGVLVNRFGLDDIGHLYEVIGALESTVILHVGDRIDLEQLRTMRELNADLVVAIDEEEPRTCANLNDRFHDTFLKLSGNAVLQRTVRACRSRLRGFARIAGFVPDWEFRATAEHAELIDLLEAGEMRLAADFLRDVHWSFDLEHRYVIQHYFSR